MLTERWALLPLSSQALPSQIISAQYGKEMTYKL